MAKGKIGVLVCLEADLETECIQALDRVGTLEVQRRCADLVEVMAAAEAGLGRIAALDVKLCEIDRDDVARLQKAGVSVILVNAESDLGAEATSTAQIEDLMGEILALAKTAVDEVQPVVNLTETTGQGQIIAVTSPPGSTGKSSIAIALARLLTEAGEMVVLVDADTNFASLGQMLGVDMDISGIAAAARLAGSDRLDADSLRHLVVAGPEQIGVLTGLSDATRWRELGAAALEIVWQRCRQISPWTIIDTAALSDPEGQELSYGAHRDDVTLSVLENADKVILVAEAGPVGILRLLRSYKPELYGDCEVIVNKVSKTTCGSFAQRAVYDVIAANAPEIDPILVNYNHEVAGTALFQALPWQSVTDGIGLVEPLESIMSKLGVTLPVRQEPKKRKLWKT